MSAASELWRDTVPGPKRLARQIQSALKEGHNVVLTHTVPLPWPGEMDRKLQNMLPKVQFRPFTCPAVKGDEAIPALLQMLSPRLAMRCPPAFKNQLAFLAQEGVLANTAVRLDARDCADPAPWIRLAREYHGGGMENGGAIFLDLAGGVFLPQFGAQTAALDTADAVSPGNLRLYANLLAEEKERIPEALKGYAACAAANLCGGSAEIIPDILRYTDFTAEHPHTAVRRLWEEDGCPDDPNPRHPYALLAAGQEDALARRVWKSQTQMLFAEIEEERLAFTEKYEELIEEALDTPYRDRKTGKKRYVTGMVDEIRSAADTELGSLVFMTGARRYDDETQLLLYIRSKTDYQRLVFLRDLRNDLAHRKLCEPEKVKEMLEGK